MTTIIKDGEEIMGTVVAMVDDTPATPIFVQDQQQVCNEEVTITTPVGVWVGNAVSLFDRNMATALTSVAGGTIVITFRSPLLIGRITLAGTIIAAGSVTVTHVDGVNTIYVPGASVTGWDSGNFVPYVATVITIVQGAGVAISEASIFKVFEIKGDISLDWENAPELPLFVQNQGQVVNEEVVVTVVAGVWVGALTNIFDKDYTTTLASVAGGTIRATLNTPLLIGRISIMGNIPGNDTITITWIDGTTTVYNTGAANVNGWDSNNFTPKVVTRIDIIGNALISIRELCVFKVLEVKNTVGSTPAYPSFTQMPNEIVLDEVTITSGGANPFAPASDFPHSMDKNINTQVASPGPGAATMTWTFNSPHLIDRITLYHDGLIAGSTLTVNGIGGVTKVFECDSLTSYDTGNFTPMVALNVVLTVPNGSTLFEATIFKAIEVKPMNDLLHPLQTALGQQVGLDDVVLTSGGANPFVHPERTLDKDVTSITSSPGPGNATLNYGFNAPQMISRIYMITGVLAAGSTIVVTDINNITTTWNCATTSNFDTGNFPPIVVRNVVITVPSASDVYEVVMLKMIEVKSYSEVMQAGMGEFYGQKVYFDPLIINAAPQMYLLMRDPLGVSADNDPAQDLDGTTALVPISGDAERIALFFYVPHDDIRRVRRHAKVTISGEVGASATWTTARCRAYRTNITTGVQVALTAEKSVALALLGATSRRIDFILQDLDYAAIPQGEVLTLRVALWASATVASFIRLSHSRGKPDIRFVSEIITGVPEIVGV